MTEKFALKITSAVAIDGEIKKANSVVHVGESLAKDLLNRGKAVVATAEDVPAAEPAEPEVPEAPEGEPSTPRKKK